MAKVSQDKLNLHFCNQGNDLMSLLLTQLYNQYDIKNLSGGVKTDRLGDLYEDYVIRVFNDWSVYTQINQGLESAIIRDFLGQIQNGSPVHSLTAQKPANLRTSRGGAAKTDIVICVNQVNCIPITVKQSKAQKVALAEYDVLTICNELGIQDPVLIHLLEKHQRDASAKNFSDYEKNQLSSLLAPYAESLVRWCLTLSPIPTSKNINHPEFIFKFILNGNDSCTHYYVSDIKSEIDRIMLNNQGNLRSGGFGTGLSWTYATGSKGLKIQFKG